MHIDALRLSLATLGLAASFSAQALLSDNQEVQDFIADVSARHGFTSSALKDAIDNAKFRPDIIKAISHPAESKPWYQYRALFLTPSRINSGVAFYQAHQKDLLRAEKTFGVPPEVIVAILGVETRYGTNTGSYSVLDSLVTLAFGYPKRAPLFKNELEAYFLLAREEHLDLHHTTGSYAGAMGQPQFIASSYRSYAVDFDGDGKRDIINSPTDAIGSVANYFKMHGWKAGAPVTINAVAAKQHYQQLATGQDLQPKTLVKRWRALGLQPTTPVSDEIPAALITLENKDAPEYWLGFNNFYTITRYNHSPLYAMAVYQLSQEIKKRI